MGCHESQKEMEEATPPRGKDSYVVRLPRPLNIEEKKYLLAVERGDLANVRRLLHAASKGAINGKRVDPDCMDSLGRTALTLAIEAENLQMIELLVVMGVETKDALLRAIDQEFVEAVELLLEHEELLTAGLTNVQEDKEIVHSWQKVDPATARYPTDMTPLVLAAQRNNYEILKLLLDRGATLPMPHDVRCGCTDCIRSAAGDPLRVSSTRISEYKALASPCLIALGSPDPLMTAFQLSCELRELATAEPENRSEYSKLRRQVEIFAVELLQQVRTTAELNTILNHSDDEGSDGGSTKDLTRLELAVQYKQKKFLAHSHVQQLLAAIWYEGVPGFRRMSTLQRFGILAKTTFLFPFYSLVYFFAPDSKMGQLIRRPFMKFLIHASSYLFFLFVLMLVSQRADVEIIRIFGNDEMRRDLDQQLARQRGATPSPLEAIVVLYVLGFIVQEAREVYVDGLKAYLRDMWNFIDFTRNFLYVATGILRVAAYLQQRSEIQIDPTAALVPRESWNDFDPQLIAEGLFAAANIFSALKLVHLFSINPHLGPLQISLGRMVIDIVKFFFIYTLVLFAFACGLNQLLWYFAELERRKCYSSVADPSWDAASDVCIRWRRFSSLFESCQSLFWASFGGIGIESFELTGIKSYTRFWGLLMFGSYSVINIIVLLNLLIAMMSNSYAVIEEHADTEWKYARTKLWMSYFEEGDTLPPPFNIFPPPKFFLRICGIYKKSTKESGTRRAREHKYGTVMKALIWRFVVSTHSEQETEPMTEDHVHELKSDISSWRCELLDIFSRNGIDVAGVDKKEKAILGKRMKVWERQLMQDFHLMGPISMTLEEEAEEELRLRQPVEGEDNIARWKRIARLAVLKSAERRWGQVVNSAIRSSQIGKSNSRISLENQESLKKAMEEARKFANKSPPPIIPVKLPESATSTILHVLRDIIDVDNSRMSPLSETQATNAESVIPVIQEPKMLTEVGWVDEKRNVNPEPLVPLRSTSPRVIKRKLTPISFTATLPQGSSSNYLNPLEPISNGNHTGNRSRSRSNSPCRRQVKPSLSPRRIANEEDRQRLVNIAPKSPRFSSTGRSPRKGGWL